MPAPDDARTRMMRAGSDAFDRGEFFEAHELWEDVWRVTSGAERTWIQGLIQLAAALVKMDKSAFSPCLRLATRAGDKLHDAPHQLDGIDLHRAREVVRIVSEAAAASRCLPVVEVRLGRADPQVPR